MPLHIDTPLIRSARLSRAGADVWLKMDALQPSGSFKLRGIGAACTHHAATGRTKFVSSSGGNAGIAVAYAGRQLGVAVTVFVPETTTETAKTLIREQGAEIVVGGASWQEANQAALAAIDETAAFIHPFDDPLLWDGHATLIDEVVAAGVAFDAVVLSVGGGGLLCGIAAGLARNGLDTVPIVAVETAGADSLAEAIAAGRPVELPAITSIATSLGARRVCDQAYELTRSRPIESRIVSDSAAVDACLHFLDDHRVLVEPACGAALAAVYGDALPYDRILVVVCGGATASLAQLAAWQASV
jgi:L-serine/L-threonine ammonia-lyase